MYISDEVKRNELIGEVTIRLIFNREEVTTDNLVSELKSMAESETDEVRLLLMHEVRRWLLGYLGLGCLTPERAGWLDKLDSVSLRTPADLRLVVSRDDD
ncbi:hypothetical protein [Rosenbergiella nectarea]|uniref:hypothetical protein n=1 Tax=Rosenbergiella nectarea TaxID=988801 RepID=UPI001BDA04C9|nr:hypothetical protein [Rosenbergiella nectarea]MBT0730386.1 hypothetical protein [Rosenbergiella nectarea subsp. apis]